MNNLKDLEETYFRVAFKKHAMEDQLYVVVGGRARTGVGFSDCFYYWFILLELNELPRAFFP